MEKKKQPHEAAIIAVGSILILLLFISAFIFHFSFTRFEGGENPSPAAYHLVMVGKAKEDPFWKEVYRGAQAAAGESGVAVEIVAPAIENGKKELAYLDMAVATKVDGIITHVTDSADSKIYIDKAVAKGIPTFTIETDSPASMRQSFIGVNSYNLGIEWGKQLIAAAEGKPLKVAMLVGKPLPGDGPDSKGTAEGLMYSGVVDTVRDYPEITISSYDVDRSEPFGTEEVIKKLMQEEDINFILCTTADGTVSAAETLINMNKVGKIGLIGYHDSQEILEYIKKDVLYATVSVNAYQMGYNSIKAMVELKESGGTNLYITTPITVITVQNVSGYLHEEATVER